MKRLLYLVALSLMALLLYIPAAGAQQYQTQQGQMQQGQAQQGGQNVTVMIEDNYFSPANITVPVGTTVTWVQSGNNPHTTTSYDGLWDSGILPGGSGQSFSFTFNQPGTYTYFCRPHEAQGMVGSVTVTAGGGTTTTTQAGQDRVPGDDDPHSPEPHPQVASHEALAQIAGQPVPSAHPGQHPGQVPAAPTQGLPATGGVSVILPVAALLLVGSSVLAFAALRGGE